MRLEASQVFYGEIPEPETEAAKYPADLNERTMKERLDKVLRAMRGDNLDFLFIYADREHGGNFGYLTGFEPRFEEAVLVLHGNGQAYFLLGNENLKMAQYARISAEAIHVPHFSLPNQPMDTESTLEQLIQKAGISEGMKGGTAGWKMFNSSLEDNEKLFDIPGFLVDALKRVIGEAGKLRNKTALFIHPDNGVRICVNANEAAFYEYGASQAAACIKRVLDHLEPGKTEMELARYLNADGQPLSVQTICASGKRFTNGVIAPRNKRVERGEAFSATMGLRGGLTCRAGVVAGSKNELPAAQEQYLERVAKPYFSAVAAWYSAVRIGALGGEIYQAIEKSAPKQIYGWYLNPGHLTATEEWVSSPFYPNSAAVLKSGMMLQMDIIFSVPGYPGINGEDGILLADQELRTQIREQYPGLWERIQKRRNYMTEILGIPISEEVLPLSGLCGYLRPYLLARGKALYLRKS